MRTPELYAEYSRRMQTVADLRSASAVLQWDQETYLPKGSASFRGRQISTLSELSHRLFTEASLGELMHDLLSKNDLHLRQRRNVERSLEDFEKTKRYPPSFVRALSDQVNISFHAWIEARESDNYQRFGKELDALIALKKEEAALLGFEKHPYDALLNEYEKGATVSMIDKVFEELIPSLQSLLDRIKGANQVDDAFLRQHFGKEEQWAWGLELIEKLGFDLNRGRQDLSEHPFSTSFSPDDVRITTRIDEGEFANMTWSCIHEVGHALYEQGLPVEEYGLPLGEACSYSIHESQSRLWENNVGRALPFWTAHYPSLQKRFPDQLGGVTLQQFYEGINKVTPSLIRTEADEITYHFHVFIRYELEKRIMEGALTARDIPDYWNEQYRKYLGLTVPDDRQGCLQDVHWSHGSFGYFPTYSLGSFYAAQFYEAAETQLPGLAQAIATGDSSKLLQWLREKVHRHGRYYTSEELCKELTGSGLNITVFMNYLLQKYVSIYNL